MKTMPIAVVSFLVVWGFGIWPAQAQFGRGAAGVSRGFVNGSQRSPTISSGARQSLPASPAGTMAVGPHVNVQSSVSASRIVIPPQFSSHAGRTRTIISTARGNSLTLGRMNHGGFHHGHHGHGFPQFVVIDVPYFVGSNVVTTQYVPGDGWIGTPLAENYPTDGRTRGPGQLAPFDPTPQEVVERMLALAAVKKTDVLYDLGAGDGRVVITAAKKYGVKAVGFEIDPGLVKLARENARKQGVEKLVQIRQEDFMNADLSPATVVTLYLSYDGNLAVRPKLLRELKPSARVVSYTFDMGDWQPKIAESYRDAGGDMHMLYLWRMADPLAFTNMTVTEVR